MITNNTVDETRTEFIENVKKWNSIDTQIKLVNEKTKKIREMKTYLAVQINEYMKNNNLASVKFNGGEIRVYEKKEYETLTFSYIEECLENLLEDEEQIEFIMEYLRTNREVKTTPEIRKILFSKND
jgi:hypothetical protein